MHARRQAYTKVFVYAEQKDPNSEVSSLMSMYQFRTDMIFSLNVNGQLAMDKDDL